MCNDSISNWTLNNWKFIGIWSLVIVRQKALADPPIFVAENLIGYFL